MEPAVRAVAVGAPGVVPKKIQMRRPSSVPQEEGEVAVAEAALVEPAATEVAPLLAFSWSSAMGH